MRVELRYVFDPDVSANNGDARAAAVKHIQAMSEPFAWVQDQLAFDAELAEARKIGEKERLRREGRWAALLRQMDQAA